MIRVIIILCFSVVVAFGQKDDPVLFSVEGKPVHVSEFDYIYNKNNGDNANYSRASLIEYLDLYIKFKLKVQKARDMRLDTIQALIEELAGYRQQLSNSYLIDKEVTNRLLQEAYNRKQKDLRVSHILVSLDEKASKADGAEAYQKASSILDKINGGTPFEEAAKEFSEDKNSGENGGDIGFITALLPKGFYAFENAIYDLEPGAISEPVLSRIGYHVLKVTDERDAFGEMEASHILIRKKKLGEEITDAQERIQTIYELLGNGAKFEDLAQQFSEDQSTAKKGGRLGYFGINRFEEVFENQAFALKENGDYSSPFESSIGWHIIKRSNKRDFSNFEKQKVSLQNQISQDDRFKLARNALIDKIKVEGKFTENEHVLTSFSNQVQKDFYSYKWNIPELGDDVLFHFDEYVSYSIQDFATYCKRNTRRRLQFNKQTPIAESINEMYAEFVDEKAVAFEESRLESKYPEFKSLMREYEEGILLFEVTKLLVWDKASSDTSGLQSFYNDHKDQYFWNDRALVNTYTLFTEDEKLAGKIHKSIRKKGAEETMAKYNKEAVTIKVSSKSYELGRKGAPNIKWEAGAMTNVIFEEDKKSASFQMVESIIPKSQKTIDEARGYIIADYQDYLEEAWVKQLREEYEVEVDQKVFKGLAKN